MVSRETPQDLLSLHYSGIFGSQFFLEGQYAQRQFTFQGEGGTSRDLIDGSLFLDQITGATWFSPFFCACSPEERDNRNLLVKGNYFLTKGGSHQLTFGYDLFNDMRKGDNRQSGSDFHVWTLTPIIQNGEIFPVIDNDGSSFIVNWPISQSFSR